MLDATDLQCIREIIKEEIENSKKPEIKKVEKSDPKSDSKK